MKKKERCCFVSPYSIHILFHCLASGFCLNVLNQNLEILKSVNFQYAHCVHSCISVVIVIYLLFSLTFNRFFFFRVFLVFVFIFKHAYIYQTKWWLNSIFFFVSFEQKISLKNFSAVNSTWYDECVCTSFRASCFFLFINTINLNPPVCNTSPLFFYYEIQNISLIQPNHMQSVYILSYRICAFIWMSGSYLSYNSPINAINCWIHQRHRNSLYPFAHSLCAFHLCVETTDKNRSDMHTKNWMPYIFWMSRATKKKTHIERIKWERCEIEPGQTVGTTRRPNMSDWQKGTPEIIINYYIIKWGI